VVNFYRTHAPPEQEGEESENSVGDHHLLETLGRPRCRQTCPVRVPAFLQREYWEEQPESAPQTGITPEEIEEMVLAATGVLPVTAPVRALITRLAASNQQGAAQ
jgi:hypothetical protein